MNNAEYMKQYDKSVIQHEGILYNSLSKSLFTELSYLHTKIDAANNAEMLTIVEYFQIQQSEEIIKQRIKRSAKLAGNLIQKRLLSKKNEFDFLIDTYIERFALFQVTKITETIRGQIRTIIQNAINEGFGAKKTAELFSNAMPIISINRALVIARTEINGAFNYGAYTKAQEIAGKFPELSIQKKWKANIDNRERKTHRAANKLEYRDMGEAFNVGNSLMQRPHDPAGEAKEIIQCRCTLLYKRESEI